MHCRHVAWFDTKLTIFSGELADLQSPKWQSRIVSLDWNILLLDLTHFAFKRRQFPAIWKNIGAV